MKAFMSDGASRRLLGTHMMTLSTKAISEARHILETTGNHGSVEVPLAKLAQKTFTDVEDFSFKVALARRDMIRDLTAWLDG
jgi:hypothetical protein